MKYEAGRVANPDRIFFDLPDTKLASVLVGKSFAVEDGFLKKIRVAQYQPGSTRVVLEVDDVSDYSAFLLPNPYRLIIDIHGRQPHNPTEVANATPASTQAAEDDTLADEGAVRSSRSIVTGNLTPPVHAKPAIKKKPRTHRRLPTTRMTLATRRRLRPRQKAQGRLRASLRSPHLTR